MLLQVDVNLAVTRLYAGRVRGVGAAVVRAAAAGHTAALSACVAAAAAAAVAASARAAAAKSAVSRVSAASRARAVSTFSPIDDGLATSDAVVGGTIAVDASAPRAPAAAGDRTALAEGSCR